MSEPTNTERAARGESALAAYDRVLDNCGLGDEEIETLAQDMITDVLHYFDTLKEHPLGSDKEGQRDRFDSLVRMAFNNYAAEEAGIE